MRRFVRSLIVVALATHYTATLSFTIPHSFTRLTLQDDVGFMNSRGATHIRGHLSRPPARSLHSTSSPDEQVSYSRSVDPLSGLNEHAKYTNQPPIHSEALMGTDAAHFDLSEQSLSSWATFCAATGAVLTVVSYIWFLPAGPHLGSAFLSSIQSLQGSTDSTLTMFNLMLVFSMVHSGLAALRPYNPLGEVN